MINFKPEKGSVSFFRMDHDCNDNRFLEKITNHLNRYDKSRDKGTWYAQAKSFEKGIVGPKDFYKCVMKRYKQDGDCVTNQDIILYIPLKAGDIAMRNFKITEMVLKIKSKN